jgi:hypothetical protein
MVAVVRARRAERPVPGAAIGAIAVSLVSLGMVAVTVLAYGNQRAFSELRAFFAVQPARTDGLAERRLAAELDKETACKLVEQQLVQLGFAGNKAEDFVTAHCDGELTNAEDRARLDGVRAQFITREVVIKGCFLRKGRWFVLALTRHECVQPLDVPDPPVPPTESALVAYERKVRQSSEQARDAVAIQSVTQKLEIVKNAAAALGALTHKNCDEAEVKRLAGAGGIPLDTIDLGVYSAGGQSGAAGDLTGTGQPNPSSESKSADAGVAPDGGTLRIAPWRWMTSERVRRLSSHEAAARRQAAREFDELEGSLVVVYRADARDWPEFVPKWGANHQYMFTTGVYKGWIIVFNLDRGEPLCTVRLEFASSGQVNATKLGMMPETTSFPQMLDHDMRTNFQETATAALARIAPSLTLGYMVVE